MLFQEGGMSTQFPYEPIMFEGDLAEVTEVYLGGQAVRLSFSSDSGAITYGYPDFPTLYQQGLVSSAGTLPLLAVIGGRERKGEITLKNFPQRFDAEIANRTRRRSILRELSGIDQTPVIADTSIPYSLEAKTDRTSFHGYGPEIFSFLQQFPRTAVGLDLGAGLRVDPWRSTINAEIYDYPSTDLICWGNAVPLPDASLDYVICVAVLEHVPNPFEVANEIKRLLKPGGRAYISIPFLQHEHGYPSHYFNATRAGVRQLFEGLSVERQFLDHANHPLHAIKQMLWDYATGLAPGTADAFLNAKVAEILAFEPHVLSEEVMWRIAHGTSAIFKKAS